MQRFEILDLYLEGFAKIHTGMHIDRLYLDFSQMPHETFLLVGDSGSGKSSILKSIHPFAFNNGTGDESANRDLIMNGRDGVKVIRYLLGKDEVTCKHLYIRKPDDSLQVKSFFSINGEELNPSGLVTTFKELIQEYLYIDESFLTLLALGNSVRGMVEYTASERKKLAVQIFTELNVYMTYYKNASAVVRDLKTVLANVVDKLDRYGSYDKKEIEEEIKDIKRTIKGLENELDAVLIDEGAIKTNLEINQDGYKQYEVCEGLVTELLTKVESLKLRRKTSSDVIVLENDKNNIMKNITTTEIRIESLESTIKSELDFKEVKLNSKSQMEDSINRMENSTNKKELEKLLANISAELVELDDVDVSDGVDYKKKKDELVTASIYLDELRGLCADLVTSSRYLEYIPEILSKYLKNKHFEQEMDVSYQAILERITNLESANHISGQIKIPKISYECKTKDCPYKRFYQDSMDVLIAKKEKATDIFRLEEEKLHVAEDKREILFIIKKLYSYIDKHESSLKIVPVEIFNPETFVELFITHPDRQVYDLNKMTSMISYLEMAERKSQLLTLQKSTKDQLNGLESTIQLYDSIKVDLERTIQAIKETDEVVESHQKDLEYNKNQLKELNDSVKALDAEIELAKELEDYRNQIKENQKQLSSMEDCKKNFDALSVQLNEVQSKAYGIRDNLNEHRTRLNQLENMLHTINSLETEKKTLTSRYSEAVLIKDAVSPSKGIPVEFIDDVIRNQMIDSINELMHVAYPDITLIKDPDKLIINDKEFTIPYKKNGVIVDDISEASDGERAMMSLAFSLVLIRLVSKVYNIMLLDEMDTSLDKYGRSKYIDIIEQYMTTISASQVFLISHNSMFDMYNVNVLQTTKSVMDSDDNKFIVKVYEQNITPEQYRNINQS